MTTPTTHAAKLFAHQTYCGRSLTDQKIARGGAAATCRTCSRASAADERAGRLMQVKKLLVSQRELHEVDARRDLLGTERRQVKAHTSELEALEADVIGRLVHGANVEPGPLVAQVDSEEGKRSPAWKHEFEALCKRVGLDAEAEVAKIVARTPATTHEVLCIAKQGN